MVSVVCPSCLCVFVLIYVCGSESVREEREWCESEREAGDENISDVFICE